MNEGIYYWNNEQIISRKGSTIIFKQRYIISMSIGLELQNAEKILANFEIDILQQ